MFIDFGGAHQDVAVLARSDSGDLLDALLVFEHHLAQ